MKTTQSTTKWLLVLILTIYPLYSAAGQTIYVDAGATGANNGSSWANAYKYLQNALTLAVPNDAIWVAQGTYRPDEDTAHPGGTNDRTATFQLKNGVAIYGGFPSGGGVWESRDPNTHKAVLSGDIGVEVDNSDNNYHVVTGSDTNSTAILDGFTITAGNANASTPHDEGGGMYNWYGSPTVTNCTFSGNAALDGGGMYNVQNSIMVADCIFSENWADVSGGGICNYNTDATIKNCTFCRNSAMYGGAMYNTNRYHLTYPMLVNCIFAGNSASRTGGGIFSSESSPTLINCIFSANLAKEYDGGGMFNDLWSELTLVNCTFTRNSAARYGGAMKNDRWSDVALINCIVWGDIASVSGDEIYNYGFSDPTVTYCDIRGGYLGLGNINADPLFVDANGPDDSIGTEDDNLRLLPDSPCIDAGNNSAVPGGIVTDLDGRDRFVDGDCNTTVIVDMGAFEFTYAYIGDFDGNCAMDFFDFAIQAGYWMADELLVDIAPTPAGDGVVDIKDLAILCDNWLAGK
jgi:hypothetical protein